MHVEGEPDLGLFSKSESGSVCYHWQELPQVSFLSQQKFCRNKRVFVATKHVLCRNKSMLVMTILSQNSIFVATKLLS